jgi:hypothetical protein
MIRTSATILLFISLLSCKPRILDSDINTIIELTVSEIMGQDPLRFYPPLILDTSNVQSERKELALPNSFKKDSWIKNKNEFLRSPKAIQIKDSVILIDGNAFKLHFFKSLAFQNKTYYHPRLVTKFKKQSNDTIILGRFKFDTIRFNAKQNRVDISLSVAFKGGEGFEHINKSFVKTIGTWTIN